VRPRSYKLTKLQGYRVTGLQGTVKREKRKEKREKRNNEEGYEL
jgi:hypothetical protein